MTYQKGSVVFNNWVIVDMLGAGSFGKVFTIQRKDAFTVDTSALKVITVPQNESEFGRLIEDGNTPEQAKRRLFGIVENIVNEIKIMSKLKATANIVSYEDHEIIPHEGGNGWDILIRMELLHPLIPYACDRPFSRRDIIKLGIDMCRALELCQKYNIIHRDIKPENIFISDNGDYKLGDFGIARTVEKTNSGMTKTGTYTYMAPEVFRGEKYDFTVDIYSLGIVMYRLLNKNRTPFLPVSPAAEMSNNLEEAQIKRMRGDPVPKPFYSQGRLPEIVLKACSPLPEDRYSSPGEMRRELEDIFNDADEKELIYPSGDELIYLRNYYDSLKSKNVVRISNKEHQTSSAFGTYNTSNDNGDGTVSAFGTGRGFSENQSTERPFNSKRNTTFQNKSFTDLDSPKKKRHAGLWISLAVCMALVLTVGFFSYRYIERRQLAQQKAEENRQNYIELMRKGSELWDLDPNQAAELFLKAQELCPEESEPYILYSYALYRAQRFDECIQYIEDTLAMGKGYPQESQNRLSEILGAAYFEKGDYAAAASFFRYSTAGGDITVPAMRDYAVSLGRLGDYEAAKEIISRMYDSGAEGDVTAYVQAEIDYSMKEYLAAEIGFNEVLNETQDVTLQKRALRSLAEVYRDCCALARTNKSPILSPAVKEVDLLTDGIERFGLRSDSTLWEMLGMAYFEAYHTDYVPQDYLKRAAECFNRVIELGISKDYLYVNLYTVYYEMQDFEMAEISLERYEQVFPNAYMPHALRGIMIIAIENKKSENERDFSVAVEEYFIASRLAGSADDTTYLQQLWSLVNQLWKNGYLDEGYSSDLELEEQKRA